MPEQISLLTRSREQLVHVVVPHLGRLLPVLLGVLHTRRHRRL
jgi:hypothetical protein